MIAGAHTILYAHDAEAARAFFRDVLELDAIDAGRGWLIFELPPGELACHPADGEAHAELYLMCQDVVATRAALEDRGVAFLAPISDAPWGRLTRFDVPGYVRYAALSMLFSSLMTVLGVLLVPVTQWLRELSR